MKCKNCGGDYRTRELICPYCGTENLVGRLWMAQRSEAELQYEAALKQTGRKASPYLINRVLGRIAVVMTGLCLLMFLGMAVFFMVVDGYNRIYKSIHEDEIYQKMTELYEEGNYPTLHAHMGKYDLFGEDNYAYSQAALLDFSYQWFKNYSLKFYELEEEKKEKDSIMLEQTLSWAVDVYQRKLGRYVELDPKNSRQYEDYCQEVRDYLLYTVGMTQTEFDQLMEDTMAGYKDYTEIANTLIERRAWQ